MGYIYLMIATFLYFPMILADKLGSKGTEEKAMLFKYSFFRSLIGVAVAGVCLVFSAESIKTDLYTVLISLLFGAMLGLSMLSTFYAMQLTSIAVFSVFKAASVIIPCVFGAVAFGDAINTVNIIGLALFLISVYLIVAKNRKGKLKFGIKALIACVGSLCANGFGSIAMQLFGKCVQNGEESVFMFISYCVQSVILWIIYASVAKGQRVKPVSKKMWIYGIIGTATAFSIQIILSNLTTNIPGLVIFPMTMGGSVILSVVIGRLWFEEKLTIKNMIGVTGAIISLIMINVF